MNDKEVQRRLASVRASAASRGYECTLTPANIRLLLSETHCQYTGKAFTSEDPLTFERVDNKVGYVPGNVIPVCKSANELKSNSDVKGLSIVKSKLLGRHKAHYGSVNAQIKSREKKITAKLAYIQSQQEMLVGLEEDLKSAITELANVKAMQEEDRVQADVLDTIADVLTKQPNIAEKYMSTWQTTVKRLPTLTRNPFLLSIAKVFSVFRAKPHEQV